MSGTAQHSIVATVERSLPLTVGKRQPTEKIYEVPVTPKLLLLDATFNEPNTSNEYALSKNSGRVNRVGVGEIADASHQKG